MSTEIVKKSLWDEGIIVYLEIRGWTAKRQLTASDLGLKDEDLDKELIYLGRKSLIDRKVMSQFKALEAQARKFLDSRSFNFLPSGRGAKFVPYTVFQEILEGLRGYQADYKVLVDDLIKDYDKLREEITPRYVEAAKQAYKRLQPECSEAKYVEDFLGRLQQYYPNVMELERKFGFDWHIGRFTFPADTEQELAEDRQVSTVEKARNLAMREAKSAADQEMTKFLNDVATEMRTRTYEVVATLAERLGQPPDGDGKIALREQSLNTLRNFIQQFKQLNFLKDSELEKALTDVEANYLNDNAETYRTEAGARTAFRTALQGVAETAGKVADKAIEDSTVRFASSRTRKFIF